MNIDESLLSSLTRQYALASEDAQAKIPTPLALIIKAIVNRYESAVNAYAEAGIRKDQQRRLEGCSEHDRDVVGRILRAGM